MNGPFFTKERPMNSHQGPDFDLLQEIGRGSLYRGGDDMHSFLCGYAWGIALMFLALVALSLLSVVFGA